MRFWWAAVVLVLACGGEDEVFSGSGSAAATGGSGGVAEAGGEGGEGGQADPCEPCMTPVTFEQCDSYCAGAWPGDDCRMFTYIGPTQGCLVEYTCSGALHDPYYCVPPTSE